MQAKVLNIPSYIEDPSYRYKMPGLLLKIEGRGNGIKTKIVNLIDIATALRVPPTYALKFLGHELGSQTNEGQQVINGSFTEPEMRKHLDKFIEKYVLCPNCKYPEMVLKIKHGSVGGTCNSCGTRSVLDNAHKLAAYILKNPPKDSSEFKGDKKKDGAKKDEKEEKGKEDKDDKKKHKEKEKEKEKEKHGHHGHGHEQKAEDKKGENAEEEKEEVKGKEVHQVVFTFKELEEDLIQKVTQVYKQHANVDTFDEKPEVVSKIIKAAKEIVPEEHANKIPYILFNAVFDVNIAKEVNKNRAIISQAHEELKTWEPELDTLLNLEKFLLVRNNSFVFEKYVPTILKFFYDEDLLSEEFLVDWYEGKFNSKFIMDWRYLKNVDEKFKKASKPIIQWLKDEEVEGEGDGEGEKKEGEEGGDDSDIDIDAI